MALSLMTMSKIGRQTERGRASTTRRAAVIVIAGVATIGVGMGIAQAQDTSPRGQALQRAAARASTMPSAKGHLYTRGVAKAFPSHPAKKTGREVPSAAPGVSHPVVADNRVPGISSLRQAPFAPVDFAVQNSASAKVKGRWYIAYAGTIGGEKADSGRGGVRVVSADPGANTNLQDLGTFAAPGTASLKVTALSGSVVTLLSNTGATVRFDLSTLSYR